MTWNTTNVIDIVDIIATGFGCHTKGGVSACGDSSAGSTTSGSLNSLDQSRHPKVAHGVLKLLAIHVTFELFGMFLNSRPPIVLDLVVCSSRQVLSNF